VPIAIGRSSAGVRLQRNNDKLMQLVHKVSIKYCIPVSNVATSTRSLIMLFWMQVMPSRMTSVIVLQEQSIYDSDKRLMLTFDP